MSDEDEFLTAQEAAKLLRVSYRALLTATEKGQIPATRIGNRLRYHRPTLVVIAQQSAGRVGGGEPQSRPPS